MTTMKSLLVIAVTAMLGLISVNVFSADVKCQNMHGVWNGSIQAMGVETIKVSIPESSDQPAKVIESHNTVFYPKSYTISAHYQCRCDNGEPTINLQNDQGWAIVKLKQQGRIKLKAHFYSQYADDVDRFLN